MNARKRGDPLIAAGLAKTLGDVAALIDQKAGDCKEARFLCLNMSQCIRRLTDGNLDAVIDRGSCSSTATPSLASLASCPSNSGCK